MKTSTKIKIAKTVVEAGIMFGPFATLKTIHKLYTIAKIARRVGRFT